MSMIVHIVCFVHVSTKANCVLCTEKKRVGIVGIGRSVKEFAENNVVVKH